MGGISLNIFKEMLYFHVDLTSKLHNEEEQTFIKPFKVQMLSGDHSSVWPQHLPCKQLLGETSNTPRTFPRSESTPFPRTCVTQALSLSKPSSQQLAPVLSAIQKRIFKILYEIEQMTTQVGF